MSDSKTTDPWPFWYRRMQRRQGRRAAEDMDYLAGLKEPRCPVPATLSEAEMRDV